MHKLAEILKRIAENPILNFVAGMILLVTGLAEVGETLVDDVATLNVGAHHGVIVFGLVHAFKSLPPILVGMTLLGRGSAAK